MYTVKLKLIHAFGSSCSKSYRNSVAICDYDKNEPKIIFPSGKTLARKFIDRAEMDFIEFSYTTQDVYCITILPTKTHCAVVEKPFGSDLHIIKMYPMQGKYYPHVIQIFNQNDKIGRIKDTVFSQSYPKFMCAHVAEPYNKLLFIDTSRNKPLAYSNFSLKEIYRISICPQNSHLICISGGTTLRLYKVEEYAFKPLYDIRKMPKNRIITEHCWFGDKKLLVATDKCEIFYIEEIKPYVYYVRQYYHNVFNNNEYESLLEEGKFTITCICPFTRGFIMGSRNGKFCLWTKKYDYVNLSGDEIEKFYLTRKWSTTAYRQCSVRSISINSKYDLLVISMSNNDIAILYLHEIIPQISDLINGDLSVNEKYKEKEINFYYLYKGFHSAPITGMDICQQRPLFATISKEDSTIRVWNYKAFGCKLLRMFYFKVKGDSDDDKPLIILAFHPSGYYMAVGCMDKLRIFHVMNNELRPFKYVSIRKTHHVKFSHGGHLLVVAHEFNQYLYFDYIRVYNALSLQEMYVYKDCQSIAREIQWKNWDEMLCVAFKNGKLMEWRVSEWKVSKKITKQYTTFGPCVYNHPTGSTLVYAVNNTTKINTIEEYDYNGQNKNIQIDLKVTKMLYIEVKKDKSFFLLALYNGNLVTFTGFDSLTIGSHQNHHYSAITSLLITPCGNFIITCGEDGLIFIYSIKIYCGEIIEKQYYSYSTVVDDFLADVVLVNKKYVKKYFDKEKYYSKVISLLSKKLKLLAYYSYKRHVKNITELYNQKNRTIDDIQYRKEKLSEQIGQLQKKNAYSLGELDDKGLMQVEELEKTYEYKLSFESYKYFQLEQYLIQLKVLHQKKLESMHHEEESNIRSLKQYFEKKFKQSYNIYSYAKKQNNYATNIFDLRIQQIEYYQEQYIRELERKRHQFKQETVNMLEEYHEKLQKLKKEFGVLEKQKLYVKTYNDELSFQKKKIYKYVNYARYKLKDLLSDFDEKLESLKSKEYKIVYFYSKITYLQKKKHILAYKATYMKKAIEPKEYQIYRLKTDLIKLKKEFYISLERKEKANLYLEKINKEKYYLQKNLEDEKKKALYETNTLEQVVMDIYLCLQRNSRPTSENVASSQDQTIKPDEKQYKSSTLTYFIPTDHKVYFKELIKLYHKYVSNDGSSTNLSSTVGTKSLSYKTMDQQNDKNLDDVNKQIVHLEKSLFQMNKSNEKNIIRKNYEIFKRTKENTELINNLNELKKQNKEYIFQIKSKSIEIYTLKGNKQMLLNNCPKSSNIAMFKLMNANDDDFGIQTYNNLKKAPENPTAKVTSHTLPTNNALRLGVKQQSIKNLPSVSYKEYTPSKPQSFIKTTITTQNTPESINNKKRYCYIVSEIEFISEKIHKFEFLTKYMLEKIKKHAGYADCKRAKELLQELKSY